MERMNKGKAIELLNKTLPYPEQIKDIDLDIPGAIYFEWRGSRYKFCLVYLNFHKSDGAFIEGDNTSILMNALLNKTRIIEEFK